MIFSRDLSACQSHYCAVLCSKATPKARVIVPLCSIFAVCKPENHRTIRAHRPPKGARLSAFRALTRRTSVPCSAADGRRRLQDVRIASDPTSRSAVRLRRLKESRGRRRIRRPVGRRDNPYERKLGLSMAAPRQPR